MRCSMVRVVVAAVEIRRRPAAVMELRSRRWLAGSGRRSIQPEFSSVAMILIMVCGVTKLRRASSAVEAVRALLHARFDGDELDVGALHRLVGDLARLAHLTADAVGVLVGSGLDRLTRVNGASTTAMWRGHLLALACHHEDSSHHRSRRVRPLQHAGCSEVRET